MKQIFCLLLFIFSVATGFGQAITINPLSPVCVGAAVRPILNDPNNCIGGSTTYRWTFNGGVSVNTTVKAPTVRYNTPGIYTIRLEATNICGNTVIQEQTIEVKDPPVMDPIDPQLVCSGSQLIIPFVSSSGTTFTWTKNGTNIGLANGSGNQISFVPINNNQNNAPIYNTVYVTPFNACSGSTVTFNIIVFKTTLANYDISGTQSICAGSQPTLLNGQTPTGNANPVTYQWQQSADGNTWMDISGETGEDYQPPALTATTFYKRITTEDCALSSSVVKVTVVERPVMNAVPDVTYCNNAATTAVNFSSSVASGVSYTWTNNNTAIGLSAGSQGNIGPFNTSNTTNIPQVAQISVVPTHTNSGISCAGSIANFKITVLPTVAVQPIQDVTVCAGATVPALVPQHNAGNFPGGTVSFSWTVAGSGIGLAGGSGNTIPSFVTVNNGPADAVAMVTVTPLYQLNGTSCAGTAVTYKITVSPATPPADAGQDAVLCSTANYTMTAATAPNGLWTQTQGPAAAIANPALAATQISGLQAGNTYKFQWQIAGVGACAATSDEVTIQVKPTIINAIDGTTQTSCFGGAVTVNGQPASGGNGTFVYQWQVSADGSTWTDLAGQSGQNLIFTPTQSVYVKRKATSFGCTTESNTAQIVLLTLLTNNVVSTDQTVCNGLAAAALQGNIPTGADNTVVYQWQQSTDNGTTWQNIAGATGKDYGPGTLQQTTQFRRLANHTACFGVQNSISNTATVAMVANAQASFSFVQDTACAPFAINAQTISAQLFPDRNSSYEWYADGVLIGSGSQFPGYTIGPDGDSVYIKLKAIGSFGCTNDSTGHWFYTFAQPVADFDITNPVGCAPLSVTFANTTPGTGNSYSWDFGDGTANNNPQVIRTYTAGGSYGVQLTVTDANGCSSSITKQAELTVHPKPEALIIADSTGCTNSSINFSYTTQAGVAPAYTEWTLWDGTKNNDPTFTYNFAQAGTYMLQLITGTAESCFDTAMHVINIFSTPVVNAGPDTAICAGSTAQLQASGAAQFTWAPAAGLSCTTCPDPVATPAGTATYVLQGANAAGCTASDTVLVTVHQPIQVQVSANDSVCIGQPAALLASGATTYSWLPATGLSSTSIPNPVATPAATTTYSVVGYDANNCFTDTAFVTVFVGGYPIISLGADLSVSSGSTVTLVPSVQQGVVSNWLWTPATGLSCTTCPQPAALVTKDVTYAVQGTTAFGCVAVDSINIKVLNENATLQMPNAFTPDGDGLNDKLTVRGKGIALVKSFRIFNRWGNMVFEKTNFLPNDPAYGWDGKIKGIARQTETFIYIIEVVSENGKSFYYKGSATVVQ